MLLEWRGDDEESPIAKLRMGEAALRSKLRMLSEKLTGRFHGGEITFRHIPTGIDGIPLELLLSVRSEVVQLADVQAAEDFVRVRTRARMALKSALVSGVVGWSAASNNQASNSGVTSKGFCCCSRRARRTSLISSLASAQMPERTWSCTKFSTSLSKAMVMVKY